ncbi:MAG: DegT/DnrJ/EryC1/StrS family aminotransferase [Burkholderiaceae bacterium]|nr:DegT/DnrJ/EryC1/StrS family aminotransferase [Burkholderiaceae bacterium]
MKYPLLVPTMPTAAQLHPYLQKIDDNRWYTNFGPLNSELEARLGQSLQVKEQGLAITCVAECTAGLELALQADGLQAGARVLTPSLTFVATGTAIVRSGYTPVFADVDPAKWILTPAIAEAALAHTRFDAVMPVSTFGAEQDVAAWAEFARKHGKTVIIDAAGSFGNQRVCPGVTVVFSLHATKSLGAGEGGAVIGTQAVVDRIRRLANFGIEVSTGLVDEAGTNAKLSEYHAAVGLASLDMWETIKAERRALRARYLTALHAANLPIQLQALPENGVYPTFPVALAEGIDSHWVIEKLTAAGIGTRRWYCPPLHEHKAFASYDCAGALPVTASLGKRIVGIPFHLHLLDGAVGEIVELFGRILASASRSA